MGKIIISLISSAMSIFFLLGCESDTKITEAPINNYEHEMIIPVKVAAGVAFPIVLRQNEVNPRDNVTEFFLISVDGTIKSTLELKRGMGSALISISELGDHNVKLINENGLEVNGRWINIEPDLGIKELSGVLSGDDLNWDSTGVINIIEDVYIPVGEILNIDGGTVILVHEEVNIFVEGGISCNGTFDSPILFTAFGQPWGMIQHTGLNNSYKYTFFTSGGGDESYNFGHSNSQPVLSGLECHIDLENVFICDNIGKALGFSRSTINFKSSLITRCDTGGELVTTLANIEECWFIDIPNDSYVEFFDSNDALYLRGAWSGGSDFTTIYNSVFVGGKNDGIDHNGANVLIESCVFSDYDDEGIAASTNNEIIVFNSLFYNCEQGVESGKGAPIVKVDHCLMINNEIGLRFGDNLLHYCTGSLSVKNSISVSNTKFNVWNYVIAIDGPKQDAIEIYYSMVDQAEYDSLEGCLPGVPTYDSEWIINHSLQGFNGADDGSSMGLLPWGARQ